MKYLEWETYRLCHITGNQLGSLNRSVIFEESYAEYQSESFARYETFYAIQQQNSLENRANGDLANSAITLVRFTEVDKSTIPELLESVLLSSIMQY